MKHKRSNSQNDMGVKIGWAIFFMLLVAAITCGVLIFIKKNNKNVSDSEETSLVETPVSPSVTPSPASPTPSTDSSATDGDNKETTKQYDGNASSRMSIVITKNEVVNGKYYLRVLINEVLEDSAKCKLEMSGPNGSSLSRSASVANNPGSSSCEGFDIPTSGITAGNWTFTVNVTSGEKTGSVSGKITI